MEYIWTDYCKYIVSYPSIHFKRIQLVKFDSSIIYRHHWTLAVDNIGDPVVMH